MGDWASRVCLAPSMSDDRSDQQLINYLLHLLHSLASGSTELSTQHLALCAPIDRSHCLRLKPLSNIVMLLGLAWHSCADLEYSQTRYKLWREREREREKSQFIPTQSYTPVRHVFLCNGLYIVALQSIHTYLDMVELYTQAWVTTESLALTKPLTTQDHLLPNATFSSTMERGQDMVEQKCQLICSNDIQHTRDTCGSLSFMAATGSAPWQLIYISLCRIPLLLVLQECDCREEVRILFSRP